MAILRRGKAAKRRRSRKTKAKWKNGKRRAKRKTERSQDGSRQKEKLFTLGSRDNVNYRQGGREGGLTRANAWRSWPRFGFLPCLRRISREVLTLLKVPFAARERCVGGACFASSFFCAPFSLRRFVSVKVAKRGPQANNPAAPFRAAPKRAARAACANIATAARLSKSAKLFQAARKFAARNIQGAPQTN